VFASSLGPEDWVAMEVSGNAAEIARIIEPHVARVVVVSPSDTGIRQARAKTDRLDARTLAPDRLGGRLLDRARASRHQRSTHRGRVLALAQQVHAEVGADQSNRVAPQRGGVAAWWSCSVGPGGFASAASHPGPISESRPRCSVRLCNCAS